MQLDYNIRNESTRFFFEIGQKATTHITGDLLAVPTST